MYFRPCIPPIAEVRENKKIKQIYFRPTYNFVFKNHAVTVVSR